MTDRKHDLAVLAGLVAHEYGHAETIRILENIANALRRNPPSAEVIDFTQTAGTWRLLEVSK